MEEGSAEHPNLFSARSAAAAFGVGAILAAIAAWFVNYGFAIAFGVAAIGMFVAAENFVLIQRTHLRWPIEVAEKPIRGHWETFRLITYGGVILALLLSAILGQAAYIIQSRDLYFGAVPAARHLTDEQKERMRVALRLEPKESYALDVNSMPNCDECEVYAEELREFIGSIPGWRAGGGVIIFTMPHEYGLKLFTYADEENAPAPTKLRNAFNSAGLELISESNPQMSKGQNIIVVARPDPR
jgi:hypothetical protein